MLTITIPGQEYYDETKNLIFTTETKVLQLEHSLVSISKWESKWNIPFLSKEPKTNEQALDYIKCMTLTQNVKPEVYNRLTRKNIEEINEYIDEPMTATWFSEKENNRTSREIITSEVIYYWMIALQIPFECQKWHLNRLFTLIKVCNEKNKPPKKMSKRELLNRNRALNNARLKNLNTNG